MPSTSMSGPSIAEEEANSTLSNDDGSSGDESRMTSAGPNKKRRREKHQKISAGKASGGAYRPRPLFSRFSRCIAVNKQRIWTNASGWETYAEHKSSKTVFVLAGEITRHHKSMAAHKQPKHYSVANTDSASRRCTNTKSIEYCAKSIWREARSIVSVVHN
ncbi:hypothetical protein LB505_012063 [Fusarium chuoi]|nr:hypothetical protein LB505_012063 [Fusarium chuoi]